jgi:hypothetical protein
MRAPPELERFIRDTLGCGCPDEVFDHVAVVRGPLRAGSGESAWWIEVGGRLLIAVVDVDEVAPAELTAIYAAAAHRRDADGFNRFRLVVASAQRTEGLEAAFAPIGAADDRLHLHLVVPADLPPLVPTVDKDDP